MIASNKKGFEFSNQRIESLDLFRGIATLFLVLFHSTIYTNPNVSLIVNEQPAFIVVLLSTVGIWGGIFILLSMLMNTIMLLCRIQQKFLINHFIYLLIAGFIYLFLHFCMIIFIGRWNNDIVNNQPNITFVANVFRYRRFSLPQPEKLFDTTSISTIGLNLIVMSLVFVLVFRRFNLKQVKRYAIGFGMMGLFILAIAFIRVTNFYVFLQAKESFNFLAGMPLGFIISHPYPLLPYLAYGFFGAMVGLLIFSGDKQLLYQMVIPFAVFFTLVGFIGMRLFEWTIAEPVYYWNFKTIFDLGIFLLMLVLLFVIERKLGFMKKMVVLKWFSWISLSIYLLETTVSEMLRASWSLIFPTWNQTIAGCIIFGCFNVLVWIGILFAWRKVDFKYSFEYFWVKIFHRIGKQSTKMDFSANQF